MEEIEIRAGSRSTRSEEGQDGGNHRTCRPATACPIFCRIEDDFLELVYSVRRPNYLRRYEEKTNSTSDRTGAKEEDGETPFEEDHEFEEDFEEEDDEGEEGECRSRGRIGIL